MRLAFPVLGEYIPGVVADSEKVLVVGAGIAGPAVAYWLRRYGFSPTLVERHPSIRKSGFAIDVRGIAVDVVKQMGIYPALVERRTRMQSGRYVDAAGNTVFETTGEAFGFREGEEVELVRSDLVEILMDQVADVPCRWGQSCARIDNGRDEVHVTFSDGATDTFDWLVAADGLHSTTRRDLFSDKDCELSHLGSFISVFEIPNFLNLRHSELLFESDQKLVHVGSDADPDTALGGFMFRSSQDVGMLRTQAEQRQFLKATFSGFGWESDRLLKLMDEAEDFYFDSITQVLMKSWTRGRVALLGDAGFCASPLSGQGTSLALVGAYVLAGELAKAQGEFEPAFSRYEAILRPFVEANQDFGRYASQNFLTADNVSQALAEARTQDLLERLKLAASSIPLPAYSG